MRSTLPPRNPWSGDSSTGETTNESERSEIGGTVAEAQAFKRASAMFGLGRYLYNLPTGWADFDPATKRFTDKAKAKLTGILVQHYRRATDAKSEMAELFAMDNGHSDADGARPGDGANDYANRVNGQSRAVSPELAALFEKFNALGHDLYGDHWDKVCRRNVQRISGGKAKESGELSPEQIQQLITGMTKLKAQRTPMAVAG